MCEKEPTEAAIDEYTSDDSIDDTETYDFEEAATTTTAATTSSDSDDDDDDVGVIRIIIYK